MLEWVPRDSNRVSPDRRATRAYLFALRSLAPRVQFVADEPNVTVRFEIALVAMEFFVSDPRYGPAP